MVGFARTSTFTRSFYCQKHANKVDRNTSRLRVTEKTRKFKKRRRKTHNKRTTKVRQLEVREGTKCQSGLGFSATEQEQMEQIPPPTTLQVTRKACTGDDMKYEKVSLIWRQH